MIFTDHERETIAVALSDLRFIERECSPDCDDHALRRISVQLRGLLIQDILANAWRLLELPQSPTIIAPRLQTDELTNDAISVAGGGNIGGISIGGFSFSTLDPRMTPAEHQAKLLRSHEDLQHPFSLSDFKNSCAVYFKGVKVSRQQVIAYVANKKGGAHLDSRRREDDGAYKALDAFAESGFTFGGRAAVVVNRGALSSATSDIPSKKWCLLGDDIDRSKSDDVT